MYGDRISAEVTGADGGPVQVDALAAIKALMPELVNGQVEGLKAITVGVPPDGADAGGRP